MKIFRGFPSTQLIHKMNTADGWTKDQYLTKTKIFAIQKIPNAGESVSIIPLCVVSVREFYAYVLCDCDCEAKLTPKQLKTLMNTPENRSVYKSIKKLPGTKKSTFCFGNANSRINSEFLFFSFSSELFELVLVKQNPDDQFYRAKVVDLIDDEIYVSINSTPL